LDLYEPVVAPPPPPPDAAKNLPKKADEAPPLPKTPLEAAGLQAQKVLITAKGPYPNLLAFLRATEKLTVLVSQSNLALAAVEPPKAPQAAPGRPAPPPALAQTELKLMFTYYRSAAAVTAPSAAPKNE
jgi:type IV pilus assembly protein PilO